MHLYIQTTLIHQVKTNITIIRSKVNQNRNNLITNLTVHLDNKCLVIFFPVIQRFIDPGNTMYNISHYLCLSCTIYMWYTTLMLCTISPTMIFVTSPRLYRLSALILILLLRSKSLSSSKCIELLRWCNILFVTCILRYCFLLVPFYFILIITFPVLLYVKSAL